VKNYSLTDTEPHLTIHEH